MSKLTQIESLENGKGIQYLLDSAYEIFHNPICIFNTEHILLAHTDVECDDHLWQELIKTGTFCKETWEFIASMGFTLLDADADLFIIMKSPKLAHDRIHAKVFNRDRIRVATVLMIGYNVPLAEEDPAALVKLAKKIELEILDDESFTAYGKKSYETIINNVLEGIFTSPKIYAAYIQILYEGFEDYLYLAAIDVGKNDIKQTKELLEGLFPSFKFTIYSDYIVMIMSSKLRNFHEAQLFDESLFPQNNLLIGVSDCFENIYKLRDYYDQAVAQLKNGVKSGSDRRIFTFQPADFDW